MRCEVKSGRPQILPDLTRQVVEWYLKGGRRMPKYPTMFDCEAKVTRGGARRACQRVFHRRTQSIAKEPLKGPGFVVAALQPFP